MQKKMTTVRPRYFYEMTISSSPHVHSPITTHTIMRDVIIALLPALLGGVIFFGPRVLIVTTVSVASCVFFEWAYCKLTKRNSKTYDLSAVVTGFLLSYVVRLSLVHRWSRLDEQRGRELFSRLVASLGATEHIRQAEKNYAE